MEHIFQALMFVDFYGMAPWTYNIQQPPAFSLQPQIIESTKLRDVAVFVTCSTIWKLLDKDDDLRASHELLNTKGTSRPIPGFITVKMMIEVSEIFALGFAFH